MSPQMLICFWDRPPLSWLHHHSPCSRSTPLLELFLDQSAADGVLLAASPQPEENRLVLELSEQWFLLTTERREALASDWFDRAVALDYQTLQLIDDRNNLLGRSARVGTGMILFAPASQE